MVDSNFTGCSLKSFSWNLIKFIPVRYSLTSFFMCSFNLISSRCTPPKKMSELRMPKDFLWGSASAAYQIEGAHKEGGKGISNWDKDVKIRGKTLKGTTGE